MLCLLYEYMLPVGRFGVRFRRGITGASVLQNRPDWLRDPPTPCLVGFGGRELFPRR